MKALIIVVHSYYYYSLKQQMWLDQNLVCREKCNRVVEYIQMRNKHQLECTLHDFYQVPNKPENLKLNKFLKYLFN
jgi:hypothetical protein